MTQRAIVNDNFPLEGNASVFDIHMRGEEVIVHVDNVPSAPDLVIAYYYPKDVPVEGEPSDYTVVFDRKELTYV
jgi:hypothetical protein